MIKIQLYIHLQISNFNAAGRREEGGENTTLGGL